MLGALTALVSCEPFAALEQVGIPVRTGETVARLAPFGIFRARDAYVAICAGNDRLFVRLAEEMGIGGRDLEDIELEVMERLESVTRSCVSDVRGSLRQWAAVRISIPWQMQATGLSASKKCFVRRRRS